MAVTQHNKLLTYFLNTTRREIFLSSTSTDVNSIITKLDSEMGTRVLGLGLESDSSPDLAGLGLESCGLELGLGLGPSGLAGLGKLHR